MDFNEYVSRGSRFFQENKIGLALENFEAALKLQPDNADLLQMIEGLKAAQDIAVQAAQASANEAEHRAEVMGELYGITDADKAIRKCTQTLERNPNDASAKGCLALAYYIRGLMFDSRGEHTQAVEAYSEAIKNEPKYPLAFGKRGQANLETGNYDQAVKDFEKALKFTPDDAQAKQNLARAYMERGIACDQKGDYAHSAADFERVLQFNPDDSTARELLQMARTELAKK